MKFQLRIHLLFLFGCFFIAFFLFLFLFVRYYYSDKVLENLSTEWWPILRDRLVYSSQSVSTAFYMADKAFIDSAVRLRNLYEQANSDDQPFPINPDAYTHIKPEQVEDADNDGSPIYGLSAYCNTVEGQNNEAIKKLHQVWEN